LITHVFRDDVESQRGETGIEHAGVIALELVEIVLAEPVVRDAGIKREEYLPDSREVVGFQRLVKCKAALLRLLGVAYPAPQDIARQRPRTSRLG
jgi:hypothetical protein